MKRISVPDETVSRLLCYLRALLCLRDEGLKVVSSGRIAETCHMKPSMIRKDLSYFGDFGTQGVGYKVDELIAALRRILHLDKSMKAALVGVGNVGRALLFYPGFRQEGFEIVLAFDNDPRKIGKRINRVLVEDTATMEERIRNEGVRLAIIAVPVGEAPGVAQRLAAAGVKGILSFAPCQLKMPGHVKVGCVDLATEMAKLAYYM